MNSLGLADIRFMLCTLMYKGPKNQIRENLILLRRFSCLVAWRVQITSICESATHAFCGTANERMPLTG